jgi:hypothetical protein
MMDWDGRRKFKKPPDYNRGFFLTPLNPKLWNSQFRIIKDILTGLLNIFSNLGGYYGTKKSD